MPSGYLKNTSSSKKYSRGGSSKNNLRCRRGKRCRICFGGTGTKTLRLGFYSQKERNRICEMI